MPRRSRKSYNVRPRYSCGSPAMVREGTALQVATQEQRSHGDLLTGMCGEELKARAEALGLRGIAEAVVETRKGWQVEDLITGEKYLRPFDERMHKDGWLKLGELEDWARDRVEAELPHIAKSASRECRDAPPWWFQSPRPWGAPLKVWEPRIEQL